MWHVGMWLWVLRPGAGRGNCAPGIGAQLWVLGHVWPWVGALPPAVPGPLCHLRAGSPRMCGGCLWGCWKLLLRLVQCL